MSGHAAEKKQEKKERKEKKSNNNSSSGPSINITKKSRGKHKFTTTISGLDEAGVSSKDVAKAFSKRFATSASVVKTERNAKELVMAGDHMEDAANELVEKHSAQRESIYFNESGGKRRAFA